MVFLHPAFAIEGLILFMQINFKYTQNCIRHPFISTLRGKKQKTKAFVCISIEKRMKEETNK